MRAGIKGEYENLPRPMPMRSVAPPAIESRSHAEEGANELGDVDTVESLNSPIGSVQSMSGFCVCAISGMLTVTLTIL